MMSSLLTADEGCEPPAGMTVRTLFNATIVFTSFLAVS